MKLFKGAYNIVLAPEAGIHAIKSVCLDMDPYMKMLQEMRPIDVSRLREADAKISSEAVLRGRPYYYAWEPQTQTLMLYPAADQDYTAGVMYHPAVREL